MSASWSLLIAGLCGVMGDTDTAWALLFLGGGLACIDRLTGADT